MMRVIGGRFRSRQLKGKPPAGIRPTSDRLRETLFNIIGNAVEGATFLDGFAGMGGVGIEAVSRGAELVYFVDQSKKACAIIRENLASLGVSSGVQVIETDFRKAADLFVRKRTVFDIAFLDPPYEREDLYVQSLSVFGKHPLLAAGGLLVVEHSRRTELPDAVGGLRRTRVLVQGDSKLTFYGVELT